MISFGRYSKTYAAVLGAGLAFWSEVDGGATHISSSEWRTGAIGLATALGVYVVANKASSA